MSAFQFKRYGFDKTSRTATFEYGFDDKALEFTETVRFEYDGRPYDENLLERALFLAFGLIGTSYYKTFPTRDIVWRSGGIDEFQAEFFTAVYTHGLSQFAFENQLSPGGLAVFQATVEAASGAVPYDGDGALLLQSGGKDSLLLATMLEKSRAGYTPWYLRHGPAHPAVLDKLKEPLLVAERSLDREGLTAAAEQGGLNGHVPVTFITLALAVVQAILLGKNTVLAAIAHEGDEPHAHISELPVNHQWSKTWPAEQLFADYVYRYLSPDLRVGSPLRGYSELKVAELFARQAWNRFGHDFSSCNLANYKQGSDNRELGWCGHCPKCANAFLLFAPFIDPDELTARLGGDLFLEPLLTETFKGLLGIDGVMKPFECVGETDELRKAYHTRKTGYGPLPFTVPESSFDKDHLYEVQGWAAAMLQ